jgi:hypothetical protein
MPGCYSAATCVVRDELCCDRHGALRRDGWHCTAIVQPHPKLNGWGPRRCPVVGSEMTVVDSQNRCPRHLSLT